MKIYSEINWSYYWKSILNQSKYLGFPQIFFISQSSLFFICNSNWMIVLKYFQNISAGSAFFFTMVRNKTDPSPNLEKLNFEDRTLLNIGLSTKISSYVPNKILQTSWTSNGFDVINSEEKICVGTLYLLLFLFGLVYKCLKRAIL